MIIFKNPATQFKHFAEQFMSIKYKFFGWTFGVVLKPQKPVEWKSLA